jgi:nucleoside 2-deoxyribosyltransferase
MKIFMISPVRNIAPRFEESVKVVVQDLEKQHEVFWPLRDVVQRQREMEIVTTNLIAMRECDKVYVCWDGESQGCLFDLGMAFALGKPIRSVIGCVPRMTNFKSFANLIHTLSEERP